MRHLGRLKLHTELRDGTAANFTFEGANVRKPLLSVSAITNKGNSVLFSPSGSFVIPKSTSATKLTSLAAHSPDVIPIEQNNGMCVLKLKASSDFQRLGN